MTERMLANWKCLGKIGVLVLASAAGVIAVAPPANAQLLLAHKYHGPAPSQADWHAFSAAAGKLLNHDKPEVGQTEHWAVSAGNHGTLTIRRVFMRSGMPCRVIDSRSFDKKARKRHDYTLTACRVATGQWKLAD